jgi:hypothetical protein
MSGNPTTQELARGVAADTGGQVTWTVYFGPPDSDEPVFYLHPYVSCLRDRVNFWVAKSVLRTKEAPCADCTVSS